MNNSFNGYVLISDFGITKSYIVELRSSNGKQLLSSKQTLSRVSYVRNHIEVLAKLFGGSVKKTKVYDNTRSGIFVERGIASKRYKPRSK